MPGSIEAVAIAILAKAPVAGFAKTRLAPALGLAGAASLHARLVGRAVATACAAATGPVTLWGAPDDTHPLFATLAARHGLHLARQGNGDLGARMLAAVAAANGPCLVIGTDCPTLEPQHLRDAATHLRQGRDAVLIPAEDGGYVLIGLNRLQSRLFADMAWGAPNVLVETRRRLAEDRLAVRELPTMWDIDVPEDLSRLPAVGLADLLSGLDAELVGTS